MKVLVSGGTGFVGKKIVSDLLNIGHEVYLLTRKLSQNKTKNLHEIHWESVHHDIDLSGIEIEGVINLVGENIASSRWNNEKKKRIYNSRIDGTKKIIESLKDKKIKSFVSASAIGYYGNEAKFELVESSDAGSDFMAKVVSDWEKEALHASEISSRVSIMRLGVVLGKKGGMMEKILPLFKLSLGGKLSHGKMKMNFIHIEDVSNLFIKALEEETFKGIYNAVTPFSSTNEEFTSCLSKLLQKKANFHTPGFLLKIFLGEVASVVLSDVLVKPKKLMDEKFYFKHPTIERALKACLSE